MNIHERTQAFGLLGLSIIITGIIASVTFISIHSSEREIITSTGSAKVSVKSDTAKWTGEIVRRTSNMAMSTGYAQIDHDLSLLKEYLKGKGVDPTKLEVRPIYVQEEISYGSEGARSLGTTLLHQMVVVSAADVEGISAIATDLKNVIARGVPVSTQTVEYTYSKLADLRITLLGGAVTDAKARATEIAKAGGRSVGDLQSASSGVVQVLSPNSVEVSDYGSYDTQSLEKEVMVTVRATFGVK